MSSRKYPHLNVDAALSRAIKHLQAIEAAPGRFAFRQQCLNGDRLEAWGVVSADAMRQFGLTLGTEGPPDWDPYDEWRSEVRIVSPPAWWSPQDQFAWRIVSAYSGDDGSRYDHQPTGLPVGLHAERVTVDLESGTEVTA